jgi:exopolysaccharide production protein ExoY
MPGFVESEFVAPSLSTGRGEHNSALARQSRSPIQAFPNTVHQWQLAPGVDKPTRPGSRRRSRTGGVEKRLFDIAVATLAIVLLLPLFVFVALTLLALQGRPILIAHERVGFRGRRFRCLKFRTMMTNAGEVLARHLQENPDARAEWNDTHKLRRDPRVTPIGAVLRKCSVDELPQLFNIVRGDMSLVGPRPIVDDEVAKYGPHIRYYRQVRPGLTGLWQISGRSDTSYHERIELDTQYVRYHTLGRDLTIIMKTIPAVLQSRGSY